MIFLSNPQRARSRRWTRAAVLSAAFLLFASRVNAEPPASGTPASIIVIVRSDSNTLSAEEVRAAISRELGVQALSPEEAAAQPDRLTRGKATVTWRPSRGELAVTYEDVSRGTLTRIVPAPFDKAGAVASSAVLVGNLARNEAADLLHTPSLAAPKPEPAPPPAPTATVPVPAVAVNAQPYKPVNASLFYPLATNFGHPDTATNFHISLIYGRVGRVDGAEFGLINTVGAGVQGAQFAFGMNFVAGPLDGLQVALGANASRGDVSGLQSSFVANIAGGHFAGLQIALGANVTRDHVDGIQTSFGVNLAGKGFAGAELALGLNHAGEHASGVQGAMGMNLALKGLDGVQIASTNIAGDVNGLQLGGVNIAKRVRGVQIGLVNVADDIDGVPIGLVSVTKSGGVHPIAWSSSTAYGNVGIKFATRYTYTMFNASSHFANHTTYYGLGYTLGAHLPIQKVFFDADIGGTYLVNTRTCCQQRPYFAAGDVGLAKLRFLVGYEIFPHLSLFAGGGVALEARFLPDENAPALRLVPEIAGGIQL